MVDINEPNTDIYLDSTSHTLGWQSSPHLPSTGQNQSAGSSGEYAHSFNPMLAAPTSTDMGLSSAMVMSYRQPELMLPSMVSPNEFQCGQDPSSTSLSQFMDPSGLLLVPESAPQLSLNSSLGSSSIPSSFQHESPTGLNMDWMSGSKVRKRKQSSPYLAKYLEEGRYNGQHQAASYGSYPVSAGYPGFQSLSAGDWQQQQQVQSAQVSSFSTAPYLTGSHATAAVMNHMAVNLSGGPLMGTGSGSVYANSPMSSSSPFGTLPAAVIYPGQTMAGLGHRGSLGLASSGIGSAAATGSATIKVPMAPIHRSNSIGGSSDARKSAPLLLPFHHKNDNRIIPQSFTSHSNVLAPYSVEEIQNVKLAYLSKLAELDFDNVTVVELKTFLREFNLASGGRKAILVERIHQIAEYLKNERSGTASSSSSNSSLLPFAAASQDGTDSFFYAASPTSFLSSPSQQGTAANGALGSNSANHQSLNSSLASNISQAY